ncbi:MULTISPECIES: penicillin-binding transpeptidase domain-containing protein [Clostridium]|uniref:Penicillin-binding protein n=1 Tax=Clostridium senegalense TaxID=1465809 RepID=A0A6M0H181_9CLOT|nr:MULTISPECIES: penicillin-binding transpeptidase domain-containing protein [Clostridium]NEU03372.1 penicillin-binding protein [Clostridium senegalense]
MVKNKKTDKKFSRYTVFFIAMGIIFSGIISRLLYLQVVMGEEFKKQSTEKNYKNVSKVAPRGEILDKNGEVFATSIQSYTLMFTETTESKESFLTTMDKVFKKLDEKGVAMVDEFAIAIDSSKEPKVRFNFKATDDANRRWMELRFKKDRGIQSIAIKKLYPGKDEKDLNEEELKKVDEELLKISAEDCLNELLKEYDLLDKDEYTLEEKRRLLVVLDAVKMQSYSGYKPVVIANNLSKEVAFLFEQLQPDLPGISVETQPMRYYPNGDLGSAFLGYTSKIDSWQQEKYEEKGYDVSSDSVGKAGLESSFEDILKGTKGQESIEVNKQGRKVKTLGEVEAYPGKTIQLTIDKNLQEIAEKALDDTMANLQKQGRVADVDSTNATRAAAVFMDAKTGKILALASRPGYDPNIFTEGSLSAEDSEKYFNPNLEKMGKEYIESRGLTSIPGVLTEEEVATMSYEDKVNTMLNRMFPLNDSIEGNTTVREDIYDIFPKPFYNYATFTLIPPGSIFKPLTAIAGLEEGVITPDTLIYDDAKYNKRYSDYNGACWIYNTQGGSHGAIDIRKALEVSCNYFFYDVADRLFAKGGESSSGLNYLAKYAWKFGLGVEPGSNIKPSTGIEIEENFGQVYNYESSKNIFANEYINKLVNFMNTGTDSINTTPHYKGIDITKKEEKGSNKEKEAIKKVNEKKTALVDAIKEEMKKETKAKEEEILPKMQDLLKDLIESSDELKAKKYSDKDIEDMAIAINYSIADAISNRISGANAYDASIGQGMNYFTPLQLANYMATLVNGGNRYEMHLVDSIIDPVTGDKTEIEPKLLEHIDLDEEYVNAIKEGLRRGASNDEGTASTAFSGFPIEHGAKSGSSTFNQNKQDSLGRTSYATFLGFAPLDDPQIVSCIVIFDGGHGGYAGPVARAVYEQYFRDEILGKNPGYEFKYPDSREKNSKDATNEKTTENLNK